MHWRGNVQAGINEHAWQVLPITLQPSEDYQKWLKLAREKAYGRESSDFRKAASRIGSPVLRDLTQYKPRFRFYWHEEKALGLIEFEGEFLGVACLAAKEVVDKESFVRRFGLKFEKDVQWGAISGLMDHLSRSPLFKAVLVTTRRIPFKLEPDVPEELKGRLNWARRNFEYHREKAENLKRQIEEQALSFGGVFPRYLPKQMKEEQDHARYFLEQIKSLESRIEEHLKPYFQMKQNLFAAALLFYVYTDVKKSAEEALREIESRKYSLKMEMVKTYFVRCSDVKDPFIVFHPEVYPFFPEMTKYYCLVLANDCAGFSSDKEVAIALKHMFTTALELPKEEQIEEKIHVPSGEVSLPRPRSAFIGYVVESVIGRKVKRKRVYFPLDLLTSHAIIYGKTRVGKSFLALILISEAIKNGIKAIVFDPHGTLAKRLSRNSLLEVYFTRGRADITDRIEGIYEEASSWPETNKLRLLVVLDETRLLRARNLTYCINELGKRGVGFVLITQYSTSIPPEVRNVGTYFIMGAMSEREIQRFREVTLHPSSKLITRLPKAVSFVYSPFWYPEPFFVRHRKFDYS